MIGNDIPMASSEDRHEYDSNWCLNIPIRKQRTAHKRHKKHRLPRPTPIPRILHIRRIRILRFKIRKVHLLRVRGTGRTVYLNLAHVVGGRGFLHDDMICEIPS